MNSAGYLVNYMARLYLNALRNQMAPFGIVPGQLQILMTLGDHEELTQKALLAMLDIEQATLTKTLARMERDRLIGRRKHSSDARMRTVCLTERGRSVRASAAQVVMRLEADTFAHLIVEERKSFQNYMWRVIQNLSEQGASTPTLHRDQSATKNGE